jgi:hypothetical protein
LADLKLIGAVAVKVRPDAKGFRGDTKRQVLKELAGQEYDVAVNLDLDANGIREKARRAVSDVKREVDQSLNVKVGVDRDALRKASADIERQLKGLDQRDIKVNMDSESLKRANAQLRETLKQAGAEGMKVDISTEEGLLKAKHDIDKFLREEDGKGVKFKANMTGLDIAAAQLKYATRDRRVNFFINVNKKSLLVAEGLIKSLSGLGVLNEVGKGLENLIVRFDQVALKGAAWSAAIGNVANAFTFMATSAFTAGEGVVQSIGLLAALPTALAAIASATLINVIGFNNFGDAFSSNAKKASAALEKLPPQARKAVESLRGTWTSIQTPVQNAFWVGMGDSIQKFAKVTIPVLRKGLTQVADDVGKFNAGILTSFEEIAKNGDMKKMFGNLEKFFQQATAASKPFFDALNTLGLRGSDYLPRFGKFLADISTGFKDWVVESDKAGKINVWIENGVQSLKDMGSIGISVIDMFKGITRAVNDAGGGGLPEFRDNMRAIADIMLAEPFRSRMATIFAGARKGATNLNVGLKELGSTLGRSAGYVSQLLEGLGKIGGGVLSGLAKTLGQLQFQTGTLKGVADMKVALDDLAPSFEGVGRIIGNMSRVSGEIFKGIAPVINTIVSFLDQSVSKMSGNLEQLAPALTGMVNALVTAASGPIGTLVNGLNGLVGGFVALPKPLQLATAAFLTFLALRGQLSSFVTSVQGSFNKLRGVTNDGTKQMSTMTAMMARAVAESNISIKRFDGGPMLKQLQSIGQKSLAVGKQVGGSLLAFAGGPWGLALAAAGTAFAMMGDAAAKQKAKVDDLRTALDGQTGMNVATEQVIATQLRAKDSFLWMEKSSVADSAEKIGIGLRDIQKAAEGVPDSMDKVNKALQKASDQRSGLEKVTDTLKVAGKIQALGPLSNFMEFLQFSDGANVGQGLSKIKDDLSAARIETEKFSKQLGVPVGVSAGIMSAIETLADKASTADEKLRAVNDLIRQMNGDEATVGDAVQKSNDNAREFNKNIQDIVATAKTEGLALPDLFKKTNGEIDTTSAAGSALRTEFGKIATDGRDAALKLALAQKDPQKQVETLRTEMQKTRELIAKPLALAGVPPEEINRILAELDLDPGAIEYKVALSGGSKEQMAADLLAARDGAQARLGPIDVPLTANGTQFDAIIDAAKGRGVSFAGTPIAPSIDADKSQYDTKLDSAKGSGSEFDQAIYSAQIDAVGNALSVVTSIWDTLQKFNGGLFGATVSILGKVLSGDTGQANGAIYNPGGLADPRFKPKYFANGGIETHVAQIARPSSTVRVWAEPETGGEAYIPLAASKRARSTAILGDVASRFGMKLFANGGTHGAATAPGASHTIQMDLHAAPGMSPEAFGRVAVNALEHKLRKL